MKSGVDGVVIKFGHSASVDDCECLEPKSHPGDVRTESHLSCPTHTTLVGPGNKLAPRGRETMLFSNFKVFKFPDEDSLYFNCQCRVCFDNCLQGKDCDSARTRRRRKRGDSSVPLVAAHGSVIDAVRVVLPAERYQAHPASTPQDQGDASRSKSDQCTHISMVLIFSMSAALLLIILSVTVFLLRRFRGMEARSKCGRCEPHWVGEVARLY